MSVIFSNSSAFLCNARQSAIVKRCAEELNNAIGKLELAEDNGIRDSEIRDLKISIQQSYDALKQEMDNFIETAKSKLLV